MPALSLARLTENRIEMKTKIAILVLLVVIVELTCNNIALATEVEKRPNILLIIADDLGYADLGSFGSDIETPNIDTLASEGILFTQFHTANSCAPTRAMLFSGNNNHVAGMAKQSVAGIKGEPYPGYENHLSDRIIPFPRLLKESGYHTYITGKWHLGRALENSPQAAGFERSFTNLEGGGAHWSAMGWTERGSTYRMNEEIVDWPEGRYSTDLYTERLIEYINSDRGDGKPFFALATYTSPHWPLQVPEDELDRYAGRYDEGYDALRIKNFEALKETGIIPSSSRLPPRNESVTRWENLTAEQQRVESRKMELYAAMVSNLDHHVGRLVKYLKSQNLYDNTLIIFMSDNGAAAEDFAGDPKYGSEYDYTHAQYDNSFENMGHPGSWVSYGPQWAEAGSAPFQRHKTYSREGGITAPMIIAGRGVTATDGKNSAYITVMDLAPTFLELANAKYPAGGTIRPMLGESMNELLAGNSQTVHDGNYVTVHLHGGRAMIRRGNWKLTNLEPPFDESQFELFNLEVDPGETTNLADTEPELYLELLELWRAERKLLGIVLPQDL